MYQPYGQPGYAPVSRWGMQIDPVTGVPIYTSSAAPAPPQNGYANPQMTQFLPQGMQPVASALYAPPPQYPQQQWSYPPPTQTYPPPNQYQAHQPQPSYVAPTSNNPYAPPTNNSQNPYGTTNTTQTTYSSTSTTSTTQPYPPQGPVPPPAYTNTYPPSSSPRASFVNSTAPPTTGGYDAPLPPPVPAYPDQTQTYPPPQQSQNLSYSTNASFSSSQQDIAAQLRSSLSHISVNPAQTDQEMLLAKVRSNASSPARVSGYLLKMGGGGLLGAQWQKRWLFFKTEKSKWFLHYSKQPESTDRGKIELDGCRCEKYPNVYMDKSMTFYIRPKEGSAHSRKEYFFACDSMDELFLWIATINKAAGNVDPNLLPTPSPNTSSSSLPVPPPSNGTLDHQQQPTAPPVQDPHQPDVIVQTQTYTPGTDTTTTETTQQPNPKRTTTRQESQYVDFLNIYQS